jgi:hypothetical protein
MSKILDMKQIIHIATEVVVIVGITVYLTMKQKKMMSHIDNLTKQLQEQEKMIQQHEHVIRQLVVAMNNTPQLEKPPKHKNKSVKKPPPPQSVPNKKLRFQEPEEDKDEDTPHIYETEDEEKEDEEKEKIKELDSSENDSDLDAEIADELSELAQNGGLKKRI